jgi:apolipoprotein N-acyltransferase
MAYQPDLVVWSETAFVPNIRRWSQMDPARYPYARLVNRFLDYQKILNVWLLTGNDDYELIELDDGETERYEYNAAVFFDPAGNRVKTYRKIHLVPFTEYFPFKESFPKFYEWLRNSDVYLWEPGTERVVFEHPLVRFSTPICFEDGFPSDIRWFVRAGAELIINISNDYWSLTEVEAQQHFTNALFRAVENRRPMLRASASGVTSGVDTTGRIIDRLPFYEEGFLVTEVRTGATGLTLYARFGDWLPLVSASLLALAFVAKLFGRAIKKGDRR